MISRGQIVTRLRDANFTFEEKKKRVEMYRERGGLRHVAVPFRNFFTVDEAKIILAQAGLTARQVEAFLGACIKD